MLLFRSEEHVHRWIEERRIPIGGTMTTDQGWRLADVWFRDRLNPAWRPRTPAETKEVFTSIGLTGPFWDVAG